MTDGERSTLDRESILARVKGVKLKSRFQKNQIAYSQGDPADCVFYLRAGAVKVTVVSSEGREAGIAILRPGSFFGEECLAGHKLRIATVKTLTKSVLLHMARADIARALFDNREFSELFMLYLMERNIQMQRDLVDNLLCSTENRLARLLLTLSNYGEEDPPGPIIPDITQETLAEMIGSSRTNVNLFMNKFRKLGLIEYKGKICVNRSLMNMALNEMPNTCATKLMFPVHS